MMWLLHIRFGIAVVLLSLVLPLLYGLALTIKTRQFPTYQEIKDSYVGVRDDIYYK